MAGSPSNVSGPSPPGAAQAANPPKLTLGQRKRLELEQQRRGLSLELQPPAATQSGAAARAAEEAVSARVLEIRGELLSDDLDVDARMNSWSDAALRAYFESGGGSSSSDPRHGEAALRSAMESVRRRVVGQLPGEMCFVASINLKEECSRQVGADSWLGRCEVVRGEFLVSGGGGSGAAPQWYPHAWLQFTDDDSIADITADQFDESLPRCWWPADRSRYATAVADQWAECA